MNSKELDEIAVFFVGSTPLIKERVNKLVFEIRRLQKEESKYPTMLDWGKAQAEIKRLEKVVEELIPYKVNAKLRAGDYTEGPLTEYGKEMKRKGFLTARPKDTKEKP